MILSNISMLHTSAFKGEDVRTPHIHAQREKERERERQSVSFVVTLSGCERISQ